MLDRNTGRLELIDLMIREGARDRLEAQRTSDRVAMTAVTVAKKMKNVRFVPIPEGTNSIGDNLHFDTPTLRNFAKGYAEAYLNIVESARP